MLAVPPLGSNERRWIRRIRRQEKARLKRQHGWRSFVAASETLWHPPKKLSQARTDWDSVSPGSLRTSHPVCSSPSHLFILFSAFTRPRRHLSCCLIRSPNTSYLHYAKRHTRASSRKGSPRYLRSWHVMRQAAGTRHLAKRARGGERRQK